MTALWQCAEVLTATGGASKGDRDWAAAGVSIDSRTTRAGDLFVAIRGPNHDGHRFTADAFARGAVAAIVEPGRTDLAPQVAVPDTLAALASLGRESRRRSSARVVAVTGSVGKTSTKEALAAALGRHKPTHSSIGSFNNHWGVPLSLARMPRESAFAAFEIGMNHAGEITPLSRLVRPHVAIVTTVEAVHLEFFSSVREIALAKAEIFAGLEPGGIAVLNRDNMYFDLLSERANACGAARIVSFGETERADARLIKAVFHPDCTCISADIDGQPMTYKVGIPGRHWVRNSLAVLAAVKALGGDLGLAGLALGVLSPPTGRGNRHTVNLPAGSFTVIDESYNANPASMQAAIATLGESPIVRGARRIAVLGDMLEMGDDAATFHRDLAKPIAAAKVDLVFCAGTNMRALAQALPQARLGGYTGNAAELIAQVAQAVRPGDVVMIKGSYGSRMGPIVEALRMLGQPAPRRANGG